VSGKLVLIVIGFLLIVLGTVSALNRCSASIETLDEQVDVSCKAGRVIGHSYGYQYPPQYRYSRNQRQQLLFEIALEDGHQIKVPTASLLVPISYRGDVHVRVQQGRQTGRESYRVFLSSSCP
jgi:hypothetical protein